MMMMMMGAYNGAGTVIHWMTPPPLTSHLKTFCGPKFELPALKILTTWNVHMVQIVHSSSQFRNYILAYGGYLPTATRC